MIRHDWVYQGGEGDEGCHDIYQCPNCMLSISVQSKAQLSAPSIPSCTRADKFAQERKRLHNLRIEIAAIELKLRTQHLPEPQYFPWVRSA